MVFRPVRRRALVRGAMVGGAAYYAGRRTAQGENRESDQQERLDALESQQAQQQYTPPPQYAPPPPSAPPAQEKKSVSTMAEELTALKQLLDTGILTQAEFEVQKAKIISG